jgi:transposase
MHGYRKYHCNKKVIQADETTVKVINADKVKSYMWLYCTGTDSPNNQNNQNIVLFDYQAGRAGQCAVDYLDGFTGYLQVDGYAGDEKTSATLVGCCAHARRKFIEAQTAQPKGKTGKADMALSMIQKLYHLEISLKDKSAQEKYQLRQRKAKPLLAKFYQWLAKANVVTNQHWVKPFTIVKTNGTSLFVTLKMAT